MFHWIGALNKRRLATGLILFVLATSSLGPLPVASAQAILPDRGLSASDRNNPGYSLQAQSGHKDVPTNEIILQYKSAAAAFTAPAAAAQMARLDTAAGISLKYLRDISGNAIVLGLPGRLPLSQVQAITAKLMALPEVAYAEPDPLYANQWDLFGANGINAPAAWDITTGSSSIVIADIDTGITDHADLSGRTVPGYDFISDVQMANDGDGRDADPSDPGD